MDKQFIILQEVWNLNDHASVDNNHGGVIIFIQIEVYVWLDCSGKVCVSKRWHQHQVKFWEIKVKVYGIQKNHQGHGDLDAMSDVTGYGPLYSRCDL